MLACGTTTDESSQSSALGLTSPQVAKTSEPTSSLSHDVGPVESFPLMSPDEERRRNELRQRLQRSLRRQLAEAYPEYVPATSFTASRARALVAGKVGARYPTLSAASLELALATTSAERLRVIERLRPVRVEKRETRTQSGTRSLEYYSRGRLRTRVNLDAFSMSTTGSLDEQRTEQTVVGALLLPVSVALEDNNPVEPEYFAEDDSISIDELADHIAFAEAMEDENDLLVFEAEYWFAEWEKGNPEFGPAVSWGMPGAGNATPKHCVAAYLRNKSVTHLPASFGTLGPDFECVGKTSGALMMGYAGKLAIEAAKAKSMSLVNRAITTGAYRLAIGAGLLTPVGITAAVLATAWTVHEAIEACRPRASEASRWFLQPGAANPQFAMMDAVTGRANASVERRATQVSSQTPPS